MSTSNSSKASSGIRLIDPADDRPRFSEFVENGIHHTAFHFLLGDDALARIEAEAEVVACVDGIETFRQSFSAGRHSFIATEMIPEATQNEPPETFLLTLAIHENGVQVFERRYEIHSDFHKVRAAFDERQALQKRQSEYRNSRIGQSELVRSLENALMSSSATKCYLDLEPVPVLELTDVARAFLGISKSSAVSAQQILNEFFSTDAASLISTVPNKYWFARCLLETLKGAVEVFQKITLEQLQVTMAHLREATTDLMGKAATEETELLLMIAEGVHIISLLGLKATYQANPIFATT